MQDQIILSLGSNLGDRILTFHKALALMEEHYIRLCSCSKVYETPAWGFESTPFYNACVVVETDLKAEELLELLLGIERKLGRQRTAEKGYEARTLDLDLLFYKNEIHYTEHLKVPHPKLHQRNFVLAPLVDVAPDFVHPVLLQSVRDLFLNTKDKATFTALDFDLSLPPLFDTLSYLAIEGNIGAGKTTLAQQIAECYPVTLFCESFVENPFLEAFYKDPKTHALAVETYFLQDRIKKELQFWGKAPKKVVSDFSLYKSLIFAEENLSKEEFKKFKTVFDIETAGKKIPDVILFLKASSSQLQAQIKKRGRAFEKEISVEYLQKIAASYTNYFANKDTFLFLEYSVEGVDFKTDERAFKKILRAVFRTTFL